MNARPPAGAALWTATIGNTLLALPAPVGLMFARTVGGDEGLLGMNDTDLMARMGGAILLGLLLVAGYWWATLRGGPGSGLWPRVFWGLSALYNVGAGVYWVSELSGGFNLFALLLLGWVAFMVGLSAVRLRARGAPAEPPEPPWPPEPSYP